VGSWRGFTSPPPRREIAGEFDPELYVGVYVLNPFRVEVFERNGGLALKWSDSAAVYDNSNTEGDEVGIPLRALGNNTFLGKGILFQKGESEVRFVPGPSGRMRFFAPKFAHLLARVE